MVASAEERFNAAVEVIRNLPTNGPFQPSHKLMLKFYAYYKQATEGRCSSPKPAMWNVIGGRKWEAWSELGAMHHQEAMLLYVEELKNIVETMPQTEIVADFVTTLGAFYELVDVGPETGGTESGPVPAQAVDNHPLGDVALPVSSDAVDGKLSNLIESGGMVDPAATDAIEARVRQVNEKRTMTSIVDSQLPVVIDPDVAMTLQEPFCAASQVSSVIGSQESSVIQLHEPSVVESREPSVVMSRESIVVEPQELIAVESRGSSEVESWGSNVVESQGSSVVESQGSNVAESRGSSVDEPCLSSIVESWGSSVAESRRTIVVESQTRDVVEWGKDLCLFRQEAAEESDDEEFCDTIDQAPFESNPVGETSSRGVNSADREHITGFLQYPNVCVDHSTFHPGKIYGGAIPFCAESHIRLPSHHGDDGDQSSLQLSCCPKICCHSGHIHVEIPGGDTSPSHQPVMATGRCCLGSQLELNRGLTQHVFPWNLSNQASADNMLPNYSTGKYKVVFCSHHTNAPLQTFNAVSDPVTIDRCMGCRTSQDRLHPDHFGRGAELPEACNDLLTSRAGQIAGEAERPHWSTYSFGRFMRRMPAGSREGSFLSALNRIEKDLNNISRSLLNLERILKQRRRSLPNRWGMLGQHVFLFILWPLLASILVNLLFLRNRRRGQR